MWLIFSAQWIHTHTQYNVCMCLWCWGTEHECALKLYHSHSATCYLKRAWKGKHFQAGIKCNLTNAHFVYNQVTPRYSMHLLLLFADGLPSSSRASSMSPVIRPYAHVVGCAHLTLFSLIFHPCRHFSREFVCAMKRKSENTIRIASFSPSSNLPIAPMFYSLSFSCRFRFLSSS